MTNEEVLDKVKSVMDELNIKDEDVRQDIYLSALQNPLMCEDYNTILLELVNPIVYDHFRELQEINRKFVSYKSLDKINKDNKITDMIDEKNRKKEQVKQVYEVAAKFGQLHSYIISERFLKETDLNDIANELNMSREIVESIVNEVISDIKSVLNKSNTW